jgi:alpha-1,4-digalacturonate transport system permease protein
MSARSQVVSLPRLPRSLLYATMIATAFLMLFPLYWTFVTAFRPLAETEAFPPTLFPHAWRWENFTEAWEQTSFSTAFWNSVIVSTVTTILSVAVNCTAGYAFAKFDFRGKTILFYLVLSTLMVPFQVLMIPLFVLLKNFDSLNTYHGLILPRVPDAFGVFLMRQYFQSLPRELLEAARIDGASEWAIFWRIAMPLSKPAIAVLMIFTFMWRWNDFQWPLIATSTPDMYTVQVALANFVTEFYIRWDYLMALTLVSILPVLLIFIFFQRYFVQGISMSGLKG